VSGVRKFLGVIVLAAATWASQAIAAETSAAGTTDAGAASACRKAELNPVTGPALCIEPLGASVEAPPPSELLPCAPGPHTTEVWSYQPNCRKSEPSG